MIWARLFAVCSLTAILIAVSSCGDDAETSALERVRTAGVLTIGYANEAPFAYLDPETNTVTGEAVEVARAVAKRLGIAKVDGVLTEFGALIPGLQAERYDVIAAGMYITPARAKQVTFSDPTYVVKEGFLVTKENPAGLRSYEDVVAKKDTNLGVVAGAVEHGYAKQLGIPEDRLVVFPDNASAVAGLRAGRCQAVAMTSLTIRDLLRRGADSDLAAATPFTEPVIDGKPIRGYGAFAFPLADPELSKAFNEELRKFLGTPEHAQLVEPFGFGPEHQTGGKTANDVLTGEPH